MGESIEAVTGGVIQTLPARLAERPFARRAAEVLLFWALWVGLGFWRKPDANLYLVWGIPLTLLFQLGVRRRTPGDLWVRGERFSLGAPAALIALALAVAPAWQLWKMAHKPYLPGVAWALAGLLGALAGGFAASRLGRRGLRQLVLCCAIAGGAGGALMLLQAIAQAKGDLHQLHFSLRNFALWWITYAAICCALEEVTFRGAFDAHLQPEQGWSAGAALFSSALWGLWHLPLVWGAASAQVQAMPLWARLAAISVSLLVVHTLIGVPLSYFCRRSGNLAPSAAAHALADAIRNALH